MYVKHGLTWVYIDFYFLLKHRLWALFKVTPNINFDNVLILRSSIFEVLNNARMQSTHILLKLVQLKWIGYVIKNA